MKTKLNLEEQIQNLEDKGVKFELIRKEEAKKFLRYNNFYFKLKSYAKNYGKYDRADMKGRYINLDFAYLIELSKLDMHLRKLILEMCLDVEHALKTRLMYDLSNNLEEDGYNIVNKYFDGRYDRLKDCLPKGTKSATAALIEGMLKDEEHIPLWSLVEVISFGRFVEIYELYYGMYGGEHYSSYLGSIKYLRNAAAHNTCLLNSIKKPSFGNITKTKDIMNRIGKIKGLTTNSKRKMENPLIHDFVVLLFVYNDILSNKANQHLRKKGMENIRALFCDRMLRHQEYFEKNDALKSSYDFVRIIINHLSNTRSRPIH